MRILAISDEVVTALYHRETLAQWEPDLLLSCGDLPYTYMEAVITRSRAEHAFYVHGNHDAPQLMENEQVLQSPGGWKNLDGRVVYLKRHALILAGLEGSIRYRPKGEYQYTEEQMRRRARKMWLPLLYHRVRYGRYVDIFIAHSPARGIQDGEDFAHRGFETFTRLIRWARPRLFLHGHRHLYGRATWYTRQGQTDVVNVHPYRIIDYGGQAIGYRPAPPPASPR